MAKGILFPSPRHEIDRLFDALVHAGWGRSAGEPVWRPPVDVTEEPERYTVEMDLPGVRSSGLSVTAEGRSLRIEGSRTRVRRGPAERHHVLERHSGRFVRTFELPADVDLDGIRARLSDGVLTVELPRRRR